MAFDRPDAPGAATDAPKFDPQQHLGDLLVIQVQDVRTVETEYGDRPVVVADVHVIDPAGHVAEAYPDAFLFGTVLHSQLKAKRGRTVLGVLEQGDKRPGRKPPWRLADATDAQEALALRAMSSKPDAPQPAAVGADRAPWE